MPARIARRDRAQEARARAGARLRVQEQGDGRVYAGDLRLSPHGDGDEDLRGGDRPERRARRQHLAERGRRGDRAHGDPEAASPRDGRQRQRAEEQGVAEGREADGAAAADQGEHLLDDARRVVFVMEAGAAQVAAEQAHQRPEGRDRGVDEDDVAGAQGRCALERQAQRRRDAEAAERQAAQTRRPREAGPSAGEGGVGAAPTDVAFGLREAQGPFERGGIGAALDHAEIALQPRGVRGAGRGRDGGQAPGVPGGRGG
ncbi:MAG: hypothetical protein KGM24_09990, partial [Elusimicrobia bacterium]|nr:hypothetical protein [Elusimicrobiota bacterium]